VSHDHSPRINQIDFVRLPTHNYLATANASAHAIVNADASAHAPANANANADANAIAFAHADANVVLT